MNKKSIAIIGIVMCVANVILNIVLIFNILAILGWLCAAFYATNWHLAICEIEDIKELDKPPDQHGH